MPYFSEVGPVVFYCVIKLREIPVSCLGASEGSDSVWAKRNDGSCSKTDRKWQSWVNDDPEALVIDLFTSLQIV